MSREITFFRWARNSSGDRYDSPLWSVRIPLSIPEDRALAYAREEFAKWAKISIWSELAQFHRMQIT